MKKVAFITTEFLSEDKTQGGIGNYIFKMASALREHGHEPYIFVTSYFNSETIEYKDIKVYRVFKNYLLLRVLRRFFKYLHLYSYYQILEDIFNAFLIEKRFSKIHEEVNFDIVQTPNYRVPGLFIKKNQGYCHFHRISSNRILFDQTKSGTIKRSKIIENKLELYCAKSADVVYAPSKYMADYLNKISSLNVKVVRPPAHIVHSSNFHFETKNDIPPKFFFHFGSMGRRKGTDVVAEALKIVWQDIPDVKMIFAGNFDSNFSYLQNGNYWGEFKANAIYKGRLEKKQVYYLVNKSLATVLPSRSDNLPNTVIESLCMGTPVLGTFQSSIDEIIEHGVNGLLIEQEDVHQLATYMKKVWQNEIKFNQEIIKNHKFLEPLEINNAIKNFMDLYKENCK